MFAPIDFSMQFSNFYSRDNIILAIDTTIAIDGLLDHEIREEEAYVMEKVLGKEFWDTLQSDTFFSTPWTNIGYNTKVINKGDH